jgi:hypothetical protein
MVPNHFLVLIFSKNIVLTTNRLGVVYMQIIIDHRVCQSTEIKG